MIKLITRYLIAVVLVVPAVLLLAFGPRGVQQPPPGVTVVEYWDEWTGEEGAALREVVDDFNNTVGAQKHIFVHVLTTSSVQQKTLVSTAAGVPPDLAGLENTVLAQLSDLDAIEPLDDLAAEYGITGDRYKPVFWDACRYHGKLYGLPSTPYDYALFYDQRILDRHADQLRAAGLDPNRVPTTIADFDRFAECLDEIEPNGHIRVAGYLPMEPGWVLHYTSYWFGGSWWDAEHERFNFLDPSVIEAFTWVQSYSKRLGKEAVSAFRSGVGNFDSPQNAFMNGSVAMEQQGTFMANFIHHQNPSMDGHWAAADFPGKTAALSHATFCDANLFCIPRGAKHRREAFEFVAYMQQQKPMEKLCGLHCKLSALKQVSAEFLQENKNPYIRIFDDLAASPYAHCAPACPILPQVVEEMTAFEQRLANLQVTPVQGLAEMQTRLQASLDQFNTVQQLRRQKAENH